IGEDCWIDNLAPVILGNDVCLSQGVYVCTGNHDWSDPAFGLIVRPVVFGDGCWVGAKTTVGPGTTVGEHAVVTLGSIVNGAVPPFEIHGGNPTRFMRKREFRPAPPRSNREKSVDQRNYGTGRLVPGRTSSR